MTLAAVQEWRATEALAMIEPKVAKHLGRPMLISLVFDVAEWPEVAI